MNNHHRSLTTSSKGKTKESLMLGLSSNRSSKFSRPSLDSGNTRRRSTQMDTIHGRAKNKRSVRLSQLMAAMYPGIHVGHKYCVPTLNVVPKTMGWLWNTEDTIFGVPFPRGWRPGAIALGVKRRFIRPHSIDEPLTTPVGSKGRKVKGKRMKAPSSTYLKSETVSLVSTVDKKQPTLYVHKEKGVYRVTMQPITAAGNLDEEEPVKFKVAEDSRSSHSGTSKSSSTIKIEYLCTGARRKPVIKPVLAEVSTQWEPVPPVKEPDHKKKESVKTEVEEKPKKKGKKAKSPSKDETNTNNAVDEKTVQNVMKDDKKGDIENKDPKDKKNVIKDDKKGDIENKDPKDKKNVIKDDKKGSIDNKDPKDKKDVINDDKKGDTENKEPKDKKIKK